MLASVRAPQIIVVILVAAALAGCDDGPKPGYQAPPERAVAKPTDCPPNDGHGGKAPLVKPPDTDAHYFMGSWTFVDAAGNDLVVRLWCEIHEPASVTDAAGREHIEHFEDFFSFELATSEPGKKEVTKVAAGTPI